MCGLCVWRGGGGREECVGGGECGEGVEEVGCELWGGGECVGCVECVGRGWRKGVSVWEELSVGRG